MMDIAVNKRRGYRYTTSLVSDPDYLDFTATPDPDQIDIHVFERGKSSTLVSFEVSAAFLQADIDRMEFLNAKINGGEG